MTRKKLLRLLRLIYLVILALGAAYVLVTRRTEITELLRGARPGLLVACLILSFGMLALAAVFWQVTLSLLGSQAEYRAVLLATGRSVLARYVPGSVWYAVGRATLLKRAGISAVHLATVAILEVVMSLGTVLALGAGILAVAGELPGGSGWVVPAILLLIGLTSPPVVGAILRRVPGHDVQARSMGWSGYATLLGLMVLFWMWSAGVFTLYVRSFPANDALDVPIVVGGFLLSWGVGFLAVVAPQGLGVFELTLASILVSQGVVEVAVVVAGYRIVTLIRDLIATGVSETIVTTQRRALSKLG